MEISVLQTQTKYHPFDEMKAFPICFLVEMFMEWNLNLLLFTYTMTETKTKSQLGFIVMSTQRMSIIVGTNLIYC